MLKFIFQHAVCKETTAHEPPTRALATCLLHDAIMTVSRTRRGRDNRSVFLEGRGALCSTQVAVHAVRLLCDKTTHRQR